MQRTEVLQGLPRMKFEDIYGRWQARRLSQAEAAEILGMSEGTFRCWRDRYEGDGAAGLLDRRHGKASARRMPTDQVNRVLSLYRERYGGLTPLPREAVPASRHAAASGRLAAPLAALDHALDLIVTMDDATSEIYSAFLVEEEGARSGFRALAEVIADHGLPCAPDTDRASHYFVTPKAGEKVDRDQLTQVDRAFAHLGIEHIPAYSPEARGRSERAFGTLQDRLPKELALAGITTLEAANKFIKEVDLGEHNARFAIAPEHPETAFVADAAGAHRDILCVQEGRVGNDNTVRYRGLSLQVPPSPIRPHFVKVRVRVHDYSDGTLAIFHA